MCVQNNSFLRALTLAFAAIGRVSMVTRHAGLAVGTGGEVTALFAHAAVHTRAVAVALARWERNEKARSENMFDFLPFNYIFRK